MIFLTYDEITGIAILFGVLMNYLISPFLYKKSGLAEDFYNHSVKCWKKDGETGLIFIYLFSPIIVPYMLAKRTIDIIIVKPILCIPKIIKFIATRSMIDNTPFKVGDKVIYKWDEYAKVHQIAEIKAVDGFNDVTKIRLVGNDSYFENSTNFRRVIK